MSDELLERRYQAAKLERKHLKRFMKHIKDQLKTNEPRNHSQVQ